MSSNILKKLKQVENKLEEVDTNFTEQVNKIFDAYEQVRMNLRTRMQRGPVDNDKTPTQTTKSGIGKIRVGRILHNRQKGKKMFAVTDGYTNIVVTSHNKSKLGHSLSPYILADEKGRLMENIWQFSKIYPQVAQQKQKTWTHDAEVHVLNYKKLGYLDQSKITPDYWKWRAKGINHKHPVRYPNGYGGKEKCICALWSAKNNILAELDDIEDEYAEMEQLDYIEARKRIYVPLYIKLAKQNAEFAELRKKLENGENLQILDVDGPDDTIYEKNGKIPAPYDTMTQGIHGVTSEVGSIEITEENIKLLLNDPTQPFGHGYCLAVTLLEKEEWLN